MSWSLSSLSIFLSSSGVMCAIWVPKKSWSDRRHSSSADAERGELFVPQLRQSPLLFVSIKHIERIKRNDSPVRVHDVHARFLHRADIEIVCIQELHDD